MLIRYLHYLYRLITLKMSMRPDVERPGTLSSRPETTPRVIKTFYPPGHLDRMTTVRGQLFDARRRVAYFGRSVPDAETLRGTLQGYSLRNFTPLENPTFAMDVFTGAVIDERIADVLYDSEQARADRYLARLAAPYLAPPPEPWQWATYPVGGGDFRVPDVRVPFDNDELHEIVAAMVVREALLEVAKGGSGHDDARTYLVGSVAFPTVDSHGIRPSLRERSGAVTGMFKSARVAEGILVRSKNREMDPWQREMYEALQALPNRLKIFPAAVAVAA